MDKVTIHHADHAMAEAQKSYVLEFFSKQTGFVLQTIELPTELGTIPNALYGPTEGDGVVPESAVHYAKRSEDRPESRMVRLPARQSNRISIIGDADNGIVFTIFGGPIAEREPGDPSLQEDPEALKASKKFWAEHALASL